MVCHLGFGDAPFQSGVPAYCSDTAAGGVDENKICGRQLPRQDRTGERKLLGQNSTYRAQACPTGAFLELTEARAADVYCDYVPPVSHEIGQVQRLPSCPGTRIDHRTSGLGAEIERYELAPFILEFK